MNDRPDPTPQRNLDPGPDVSEEGPDVRQMATTYGSVLVRSEADRAAIADESSGMADGTGDGLGRPQPNSGASRIPDGGS